MSEASKETVSPFDGISPPAAPLSASIYVTFRSILIDRLDRLPPLANSDNSLPNCRKILVDRPDGHMTTSQPPPLGMINVDFWSSKAKLYASGHTALTALL
ncbi:hypothetical protein J3459_021587 [Metarhizium acridum]|nr:hypothetical protein J3459_021587 [Metarhizium acridum]